MTNVSAFQRLAVKLVVRSRPCPHRRPMRRLKVKFRSFLLASFQIHLSDAGDRACRLGQGCLRELLIKSPARLTALTKPCLLLGRDSGFIGFRVEETKARINRKCRNSLRFL